MMSCDMLFLLSNVDGLYTGKPGTKGAELIPEISGSYDEVKQFISSEKSGLGRGGMESKCNTAIKIANQGVTVFIANGDRYDIITDILEGKTKTFTKFTGTKTRTNDLKTWLSHAETFARGEIYVDDETAEALIHKANFSLYTNSITRVEGIFEPDDVIRILNKNGEQLGVGKVQMPSQRVIELKGLKSDKPIIHHDYFVVDDIKYKEPKV
jgi:glutamate 5-kinase